MSGARSRPDFTATCVAVAVSLALGGCGGSSSGVQVSSAGVSVTRPAGWQVRSEGQGGIVLAPDASALSGTVPAGPRFTARPAAGVLPDPKTLARSIASAPHDVMLVAPARTLTVGRWNGVAITVREPRGGRSVVSEQVVVPLGPGRAYTFLLEAPAAKWSGSQHSLTNILDSVSFDLSAVPKASGVTSTP